MTEVLRRFQRETHDWSVFPAMPERGLVTASPYTSPEWSLPVAIYDYMRGSRDHAFTMFAKTEYAIVIPYRGIDTTEQATAELATLNPDLLMEEDMNSVYRHAYMLQRFGIPEQILVLYPALQKRIEADGANFAEIVYPHNLFERHLVNQDFKNLKYALLDGILRDPQLSVSESIVEDLYEEGMEQKSRSLYYALAFDRRRRANAADSGVAIDPDFPPISERIKEIVLPLTTSQSRRKRNQASNILKWTYRDYELQKEILAEALAGASQHRDVNRIMACFTKAMEVYDITSFLYEYAVTHGDLRSKIAQGLHFLKTHPNQMMGYKGDFASYISESEPTFVKDPVTPPFVEEARPSARRTVREMERTLRLREQEEPTIADLEAISALTSQQLEFERFSDFFKHIDLLSKFGSAQVIAEYLPTIMRRGRIGLTRIPATYPRNEFTAEENGLPDELKMRAYLKIMGCIEVCEEDPSVRLPDKAVKNLWEAAKDINPRFMRYAIIFNERNIPYGEGSDSLDRWIIEKGSEYVRSIGTQSKTDEGILFWSYVKPELYEKILIEALSYGYFGPPMRDRARDFAIKIAQRMATYMGVERMRKTLRAHADAQSQQLPGNAAYFDQQMRDIFDYMQIDPEGAVSVDLVRDVYEEIDLSDYAPNTELQEADLRIINHELEGASVIADVACGAGRLLLHIDGIDSKKVIGYDLVQKHIDAVLTAKPDADVHQASWFELPVEDGHFDAVYMLGRSFPHNTTIYDAVACLQELKRVIKDDGAILMDLPDGYQGEYYRLIRNTLATVQDKGFRNLLPGTINDSPDEEHYFDRYIPDEQAFRALCELAGLHAEIIDTQPYQGHEGENKNIYWKLTKRPFHQRMSVDRVAELIAIIRTNRYEVTEDSPTLDQTMTSSSLQSGGGE